MSQTFHITINPVDDSLPVVQSLGMTVQEGLRKTITEFELKARDADTEVIGQDSPEPPPPALFCPSGLSEKQARVARERLQ